MSWIFFRKSAARPEPRSALEPPGLTPFWRLFRFSASVDHQMTPTLFRPLFRASRSRGLHWRIGCRDPLRGPSDLKHHARRVAGGGLRASGNGRLAPFARRATRIACPSVLAHRTRYDFRSLWLPLSKARLAPFSLWAKRFAFPSDLKHHAAPGCGRWCRASGKARLAPFARRATRIACPFVLAHRGLRTA